MQPVAPFRLVMLSGSFEYDSDQSLALLTDHLAADGIEPTTIAYASEDDDPSLDALDDADALLVFTRRLRTAGRNLARFQAYCAAGQPIVALRTASHAYQNWLAFDCEVLGGNYQGHYGAGPLVSIAAAPGAEAHAVLGGVRPFESAGSLYRNTPLGLDTTTLLAGTAAGRTEPVAWTRVHRGGRVFTTSLGHQQDFTETSFLRLVRNGILWAAGHM